MSFKRKVFYLSGFDPRGARHYHAMFTEQTARYSVLAGEQVRVSKRLRGQGPSVDWRIDNDTTGTATDYSFLSWDDLIRKEWISNPASLFTASVRTYRNYFRRGDWKAGLAMQRGPMITLFYPVITAVLVPLIVLLIVFGLGAIWLNWVAALAIGIAAAGLVMLLTLNRLKSLWLLRFFIFNDALSEHGVPPALDQRMDAFADLIEAALSGDYHEVLLITHSNGSILSVPLMEKILPRFDGRMPARFALVTLGHCIPLISLRSDATRFRDSLVTVNDGHFRWIDIGSPPDGAAFTQVDPFRPVGGVSGPELEMISARIFKFHDPRSYNAKRRNKYEFHFEYLRCGDALSPIDHPSMTAGPRSLDEAVAAFKAIR